MGDPTHASSAGPDPLTGIFHAARELPVEERHAFVERACEGDPELLDALIGLLGLDGDPESPPDLRTDAVRSAIVALTATSGLIGKRIGDFELTEVIGVGGMGTVYLSQRVEGGFAQRAAVKLLPMGLDTPVSRWRFQEERRHLASLSHPSIAQVYGGGVTDDGTPYLIMEYVDGVALTDFCDHHALGVPERLQLFLSVCGAVQHAHERLVVHRDLKPSNVLVTPDGLPKLLDFGIARALDPDERAPPGDMTRLGPAFTPAYSSPEQMWGDALTTATDVFSLGVVLYELLSGERPFGSEPTRDHDEAMRRFVKLPTTDDAAARRRGASVVELRRVLRGDLSRIVSMAIRDEPEERYQTVAALAADVRRYLERRPVEATPPTLRYRLGRLLARRPTELALGALIVFFIIYSLAQTVQARLDARRGRALAEFLTAELLLLDAPEASMGIAGLEATLDSASASLQARPLRSGAAHLDALGAIGAAYVTIGRPASALPLLQETLAQGGHDPSYTSRARLHHRLGQAHLALDRPDSAAHHLRVALDGYPRAPDTSAHRSHAAELLERLASRPAGGR